MRPIKRIGQFLIFLSCGMLLTAAINLIVGLSLDTSALLATVGCALFYLMLDQRPETDPSDATIIRLTRGSWYKKRS